MLHYSCFWRVYVTLQLFLESLCYYITAVSGEFMLHYSCFWTVNVVNNSGYIFLTIDFMLHLLRYILFHLLSFSIYMYFFIL